MLLKGGKNYYTMTDEITEQQAQEMLRQIGEGKQNIHSFLTKVIKSSSTTKVGNLNEEELGKSKLPLRTYKELGLFCKEIADDNDFSEYFEKMGEIQTSTSLSKEGFLMKLAMTIKKELADVSPNKTTKNKGWFKKKGNEVPSQ